MAATEKLEAIDVKGIMPKISNRVQEVITKSSEISGTLINGSTGEINTDTYRRYASSFTITAKIKGVEERSAKSIMYEIGNRGRSKENVKPREMSDDIPAIHADISLNTGDVNQLKSIAKRFTNFNGMFEQADLCAIGYHLAKCIGKYVNTGALVETDLRGGKEVNLRGLGTTADPVTASQNSMFIPRTTAMINSPATFNVLVYACAAYETIVYSDVVHVNENHETKLATYSDMDYVIGCFNALRILFAIYNRASSGGAMATAVTAGFHYMSTVVAHTDEGGILRDVLRVSEWSRPYGGIYSDEYESYIGLPIPASRSQAAIVSVHDAILLCTAACVASADPCVVKSGKSELTSSYYPTVCSINSDTADVTQMKCALQKVFPSFCNAYVARLSKLFGVVNTEYTHIGPGYLETSLAKLKPDNNRHLNVAVMAPFFWIEPTTLLNKSQTIADINGIGPLSDVGTELKVDLFNGLNLRQEGDLYLMTMKYKGIRYTPGLLFLHMHVLNGLGYMVLNKADDSRFGLSGSSDIRRSMLNYDTFDKYLWGRGQSMLPAPAEFIYEGNEIGLIARIGVFDADTYSYQSYHMFDKDDFVHGGKYYASRPTRIANGKISTFTRTISRLRTSAILNLDAARACAWRDGVVKANIFAPVFSEPGYDLMNYENPTGNYTIEPISGGIISPVSRSSTESNVGPPKPIVRNDEPLKPPHIRSGVTSSGGGAGPSSTNFPAINPQPLGTSAEEVRVMRERLQTIGLLPGDGPEAADNPQQGFDHEGDISSEEYNDVSPSDQ